MTADSRKWLALAVICVAQFMVILDVSIVNVALPSIERGLHFSEQNLLWVLNAYALMFGGFLMLGGRVADKLGRRRVFVTGVVVFTTASLFCGLATSTGWLVTARAVQGLGAAILSPAALSILTVTFEEGRERNTALSIWGAIAGAGGAFGVLLGGILTQEFGWQWIFYVNVPIGSLVVLASFFILTPSLAEDEDRGFDIPGAVTLTAGLVLMVFALVKSTSWGWASAKTLGTLALAFVLIALFVLIERRNAVRPRSAVDLSQPESQRVQPGLARFGRVHLLHVLFPVALHAAGPGLFSPQDRSRLSGDRALDHRRRGAAQSLVAKFGVRLVMTAGMALAAGGLIYFAQISPHGTYLGTLLPGFLLAGVGLGLSFVPVTIGAMSGVAHEEAGVASGLITTTQQIGGALGVAVLSTLAVSATTRFIGAHGHEAQAMTNALNHGFSIAFWFGAVFAGIGCLIAYFGMDSTRITGVVASEPAIDEQPSVRPAG